jgi:hypothetical protein
MHEFCVNFHTLCVNFHRLCVKVHTIREIECVKFNVINVVFNSHSVLIISLDSKYKE